ncbi:MAG TPA: chemotaxis protein CheD [Candidatus Binatus sp.]|nr:chemotaxis protein CheD [Candidatus Binatus sp.]
MKRPENLDLTNELSIVAPLVEPICQTQSQKPLVEPLTHQRTKIYLHPGQLHATAEGCVVTTILGSCVAVCLCDRHAQVGGINHFLLPVSGKAELNSHRFGDVAVTELIAKVISLGADLKRLQAKLFGGANVIEAFRDRENHLGTQNVRLARALLESAGLPVISEDVGGRRGRKLIFQTDNGAAWVKEL